MSDSNPPNAALPLSQTTTTTANGQPSQPTSASFGASRSHPAASRAPLKNMRRAGHSAASPQSTVSSSEGEGELKLSVAPTNEDTPMSNSASTSLSPANRGRSVPSLTEVQSQIPDLERRNLATTVAIARHGFETDYIRDAYANWMNNTLALAYHHTCLFHATMAFSSGFSYLKTQQQQHHVNSDKHRFIALQEIQQELLKITPANTDALLSSSLLLSWDVFLQEDNISSYITLSRGLGAVLEQVQSVMATTQMALCMTESLFQSVKNILHPPYDETFFVELMQQIEGLTPFVHESQDPVLISEQAFLVDYSQRVYHFLKTSAQDTERNFIHDPSTLFDLMREWLAKFPCQALSTLDVQTSKHALVLHTHYHALTHALDALLPEARYLFQVSFIGPIDLVAPENCLNYVEDRQISSMLEYPVRLISFFKQRQFELNKIYISTDPLMMTIKGVPLYRLPPLEPVSETTVTSFLENFDFQACMPFVSTVPSRHGSTSSYSGMSTGSSSSTAEASPLSQVPDHPSVGSSTNSPQSYTDLRGPISRSESFDVSMNGNGGGGGGTQEQQQQQEQQSLLLSLSAPSLSSMSMGYFKTYFDDRMEILQKFVAPC